FAKIGRGFVARDDHLDGASHVEVNPLEEMRKRERLLLHKLTKQFDGAFSLVKVALVAGKPVQAQQRHHGRAVPRWRRSIERALETGDELLMIRGGEEKSATFLIEKALEDHLGESARVREIPRIE